MKPMRKRPSEFDEAAFVEFADTLARRGLHEALRFLNQRTPHRYTGVYRYDGEILRNEHLFDATSPELTRGGDVAMEDAYCALVRQEEDEAVEFLDIGASDLTCRTNSPVVSYCGVLIRDETGEPFGTLCHYDTMRCEQRSADLSLLEAAAPLVLRALRLEKQAA